MLFNHPSIEARLLACVDKIINVPSLDSNLIYDLGLDLIGLPELIQCLESEFGIYISDADADSFHSLRQIADYLKKRGVR